MKKVLVDGMVEMDFLASRVSRVTKVKSGHTDQRVCEETLVSTVF